MSVDPKEAKAFANILGKLDGVQNGVAVVDSSAKTERMATNDMHSILSAFAETSGTQSALSITPQQLTEAAPAKQEQVDEVENAYAVGMAQAMKSTGDKPPLKKSTITKAHEIAKAIEKDEAKESIQTEETLSDIKHKLTDYLQDIKNDVTKDKTLSNKSSLEADKLGPAIKTIKTDDGKQIKIHGNEDDGFRLKINNKVHSAEFDSFDEAQMACEAYCARRSRAMENTDYVEEK